MDSRFGVTKQGEGRQWSISISSPSFVQPMSCPFVCVPTPISHPVITLCLRFARKSFPPEFPLKRPCHKAEAAAYDWLWTATEACKIGCCTRTKLCRPRVATLFARYPARRIFRISVVAAEGDKAFEILCNWKIPPWLFERLGIRRTERMKGC